jgi:hypothetical protein
MRTDNILMSIIIVFMIIVVINAAYHAIQKQLGNEVVIENCRWSQIGDNCYEE